MSASARPLRLLLAVLAVAGGLVMAAPVAAQDDAPLIDIVEVDGVIDAQMAGYLTDSLDRAETEGATVVVLHIDSPGVLGDRTAELAEAVRTTSIPVVAWIGPPGAQATGGAAVLAAEAGVLAMAPSTTIGAAADTDLGAVPGSADSAATAGLLEASATRNGRDAGAAASWAVDGAAVVASFDPDITDVPEDARLPRGVEADQLELRTESELVGDGVVDLVVTRLDDLLVSLDGRDVAVDGTVETIVLDTTQASIRFSNLGFFRQLLSASAEPILAYVLLMGGLLCIGFELFQPGFGVAGISGLGLAAFGAYGLWLLPTRWWALALVLVGVVALAIDLALSRLGAFSAGGTIALGVGSAWLYGGSDVLVLPWWAWVPIVAFTASFFIVIMTTVLKNQGNQAFQGAQHVIDQVGTVRSMLNPEGHVFIGGQLWRARAPEDAGRVKTGTSVRVLGLNDNLSLSVEVVEGAAPTDAGAVPRADAGPDDGQGADAGEEPDSDPAPSQHEAGSH